jgi:hypothetical protein
MNWEAAEALEPRFFALVSDALNSGWLYHCLDPSANSCVKVPRYGSLRKTAMNRRQNVPFWVFVGLEIGCLLLLAAGLLFIASPFWTPAGAIGWIRGYDAEADVLRIVWLAGSVGSIFVGLLLTCGAAFGGIWLGIAAGLLGLAGRRTDEQAISDQVNPTSTATEVPWKEQR